MVDKRIVCCYIEPGQSDKPMVRLNIETENYCKQFVKSNKDIGWVGKDKGRGNIDNGKPDKLFVNISKEPGKLDMPIVRSNIRMGKRCKRVVKSNIYKVYESVQ